MSVCVRICAQTAFNFPAFETGALLRSAWLALDPEVARASYEFRYDLSEELLEYVSVHLPVKQIASSATLACSLP